MILRSARFLVRREGVARGTRASAGLVDAPDAPLAAEDAVVGDVLVVAGAEARGARREGHIGRAVTV